MSDLLSLSLQGPDTGLALLPLEEIIPQIVRNMGYRADSNETNVFLRQLTYIVQQTYDIQYPALKARQFFPVDNRPAPGSEFYLWRQFDKTGKAMIVNDYALDWPNVEVTGKEFQSRIYSLGNSYQYSLQDLRRASMAGLPLETRKAEAARFTMEQTMEVAAFTGVPGQDLTSATPCACLNAYAGGGCAIDTVTHDWTSPSTSVDQILGDLNASQKGIFDDTKGIYEADTLVLPTATYSALATRARSSTFTEDSMLQYILKQSPWLKSVEFTSYMDTAGLKQDGSTPGPRAFLYKRDPAVIQMVVPQEFEQLPPQQLGMAFKIPCHMRFGGIVIRYPKALRFIDGTQG